jgi:pantetheine-phosphate adenylyltransferase
MSVVAVYPGTFDPVTYGHIDIIERAATLFSTVFVAVADSAGKDPLFSQEKRCHFIEHSIQLSNVHVLPLSGLLVDFAKAHQAAVLVRGLRAVSDFEYELQMASINRELSPTLETIFFTPRAQTSYISSSLVREINHYGGDVSLFVPKAVTNALSSL